MRALPMSPAVGGKRLGQFMALRVAGTAGSIKFYDLNLGLLLG